MTAARGKGPPAAPQKKPDAKHWALVALAWAITLVAAAVLLTQAIKVPEPADGDDFARSARQLRSDALEAAMLARHLAAGQLTAHFARAQHEMLADDVKDVREELNQPAPKERPAAAEKSLQAADRLSALLAQVPVRMADADAMTRLAEQEEAVARELEQASAP